MTLLLEKLDKLDMKLVALVVDATGEFATVLVERKHHPFPDAAYATLAANALEGALFSGHYDLTAAQGWEDFKRRAVPVRRTHTA